jgi:hypothetical protein
MGAPYNVLGLVFFNVGVETQKESSMKQLITKTTQLELLMDSRPTNYGNDFWGACGKDWLCFFWSNTTFI